MGLTANGCSRDDGKPEVISVTGIVEKIDVHKGEIVVRYTSAKQNKELTGIALLTPETEVIVSGAISRADEIRPGEKVVGEVRVEKKGSERTFVALKITITRAEPIATGEQP